MQVDLDRLVRCFNPTSVAVVGGKEAEEVLLQSQKLGYQGPMWAINPKRESMAGISCLPGIEGLPEVPDVVFIGIPADPSIEMVDRLRKIGVGGVVCLASGFTEVGIDGGERQQALRDAAGDMPVIGPNCYGYINTLLGAALFPDQHGLGRCDSGVAIISCSGNIGINFTLQQRGLNIAWMISVGNQAVVGVEECVAAALENEKISAIGIHLEGLRNLPLFIELADKARQKGKPIVVLKSGKSDAGARITMSHTATLAGENRLYTAMFERLGIGQVDTIDEFLEALNLASVTGPLPGNRIASMSCSGGEASLMADLCERKSLVFPPIEQDHRDALKATLNEYVNVDNPLDYHTFIWGDRKRLTDTFAAMMSGGYDLTVLVIDYPYINDCDLSDWIDATQAFIDACTRTRSRGAVIATLPESYTEEVRTLLVENGVTPLHGMSQAIAAMEAMADVGMAWNRGEPRIVPSQIKGFTANDPVTILDEYRAKRLLAEHYLTVPEARLVDSGETAGTAGDEIGYPLVLKAVSDSIAHKSEVGAIVTNIHSRLELEAYAHHLLALSDTLMVEQMIKDTVAELLVGVSYDPLFGHYLILGFGGTMVELIGDSEILLLPTDREEILRSLKRLKTWPLLAGFRGRPEADLEGVVDAVLTIADMVSTRRDEILELEINPLMVKEKGAGAVVADALIRTRTGTHN